MTTSIQSEIYVELSEFKQFSQQKSLFQKYLLNESIQPFFTHQLFKTKNNKK